MKAIIGRKVGMSQIFDEKGHVIPVTVIEAGPCVVTQKKTSEKDGYEAVQLGYEDIREAKLSKPELGHLNKAGVSPKKYLREFDLDNASELELGAIIKRSEIGGRGSGALRTAFESAGEQPVGHFRILRKQRPVGIGAHNVLVARALHAIVIVVAVAAGGHDAAEALGALAQVGAR